MNTKQAKAEPLHEFLGRLGYQPARIRGDDLWYRSPFRPNERTPSFKIDRTKNVWYDHAMGQGGTIIDFVQELNGLPDISRVLESIEDVLGRTPAPPRFVMPEPKVATPREAPIIEAVTDIQDRGLETYLGMRAIPVDLARRYMKEVVYRTGGATYRALAFGNDAGGLEVRNPGFKGTLGKKDVTFLPGENRKSAAVFEGAMDFLATLAYYKREQSAASVLVLNSVALLHRGADVLRANQAERLYTYFDHDDAGRAGLLELSGMGDWDVLDAGDFYRDHKDANEFLIEKRKRRRDDDHTR